MDLTLNQITNFSPSAREIFEPYSHDHTRIETKKISPSDIPQVVNIVIENSRIIFSFDYTTMESSKNTQFTETPDWKIEYSSKTGRLYQVELSKINDLTQVKSGIKKIKNDFHKNRLKDNIRLGLNLINSIAKQIIKVEENDNWVEEKTEKA